MIKVCADQGSRESANLNVLEHVLIFCTFINRELILYSKRMKEWEYVINTVEYFKMHIFTYLLITQKQFHDYKVELFFKEQLFNNVKMFL